MLKRVTSKFKETKFPVVSAFAAGGILLFFGLLFQNDSHRKRASPAVIDAEYAGYREKVSDYPDRSQGGKK
jgi:hypothetical protein